MKVDKAGLTEKMQDYIQKMAEGPKGVIGAKASPELPYCSEFWIDIIFLPFNDVLEVQTYDVCIWGLSLQIFASDDMSLIFV